jgi:NAD(P)-dependent dehydrogenase (short-subunit alcohol dehydrogenase family)
MNGGFRLDGKAAIITGGGSGIGRAIALRFAAAGASVHVLDINPELAEAVAGELTTAGNQAHAYKCDVSQQREVKQVFAAILQDEAFTGRFPILVNNAGIAHIGRLDNTAEDDFDRVFRINVKGAYNCMSAVIQHMKTQRGGVILNLASIAASCGLPDRFAYSMSKGAIVSMTYSVAKDYLPYNVRCNCVSPARVHTPFVDGYLRQNYAGQEQAIFERLSKAQPVGRMAEPEEVASLALYLCSDEAAFITGTDYPIDGGFFNLRG